MINKNSGNKNDHWSIINKNVMFYRSKYIFLNTNTGQCIYIFNTNTGQCIFFIDLY